jgi:hypothetical protein
MRNLKPTPFSFLMQQSVEAEIMCFLSSSHTRHHNITSIEGARAFNNAIKKHKDQGLGLVKFLGNFYLTSDFNSLH